MEHPRQKIPKDGPGPRGAPDCYYTSRVLNSTHRYVKFVKKLRQEEDERRKGEENKLKELKDKQNCDFFIRCDRRSLINKVAHRVDLCMESYQEDLQQKRLRLINLLKLEEEANIRKFVEQAQEGAELLWQEKKDRLKYLLEKRKKEHEERYKDTPLSKCVHVLPCIYKLRAKEAEEIQLYQIKEKEAKKMAEKEFDKMWHEVAMKESEALAARMEYDAMERVRRDKECKMYTDRQLEQRRMQREKEKEMLKQESLRFKAIWDADLQKEAEAEQKRANQRKETGRERKELIEEQKKTVARQQAQDKLIADTWDSLASQRKGEEQAKEELVRRKKRELDQCNSRLLKMKDELADREITTEQVLQEAARDIQEKTEKRRCEYMLWSQETNREVRKAMVDQIKDKKAAREDLQKKIEEQDEYHRQLYGQLQSLTAHRELTEAQTRKKHQMDLVQQIEYNKLLKERALEEEMNQRKKCLIATEEYQREINKMACRPFFSDELHPFMKQMAKGLRMNKKCPCSTPNYCSK